MGSGALRSRGKRKRWRWSRARGWKGEVNLRSVLGLAWVVEEERGGICVRVGRKAWSLRPMPHVVEAGSSGRLWDGRWDCGKGWAVWELVGLAGSQRGRPIGRAPGLACCFNADGLIWARLVVQNKVTKSLAVAGGLAIIPVARGQLRDAIPNRHPPWMPYSDVPSQPPVASVCLSLSPGSGKQHPHWVLHPTLPTYLSYLSAKAACPPAPSPPSACTWHENQACSDAGQQSSWRASPHRGTRQGIGKVSARCAC
jgi:hypothetical protein